MGDKSEYCKYKTNTCRNLYCEEPKHQWDCTMCFYFCNLRMELFAENNPFYEYINELDALHELHKEQGCVLFKPMSRILKELEEYKLKEKEADNA